MTNILKFEDRMEILEEKNKLLEKSQMEVLELKTQKLDLKIQPLCSVAY